MLKRFLQIFSGAPQTRRADEVLVILNHNPGNLRDPGEVELFGSADALTGDIFASDIRQGGYLAVDTTGKLIKMTEASTEPDAEITVSVAKYATEAQLALRLLKHYLLRQLESRDLPYTRDAVERENAIGKLVALVPHKDVFGGA